eukprot:SM000088S23746  [mRNA]  locus=s88:522495:525469:+ [translate_table: standard]
MPVLGPGAGALVRALRQQKGREGVHAVLEPAIASQFCRADLAAALAELRRQQLWPLLIQVYEWLLDCGRFQPDIVVVNLLLDAYVRQHLACEAEALFARMTEQQLSGFPSEASWSLLMRARTSAGQLRSAEEVFSHLVAQGFRPGVGMYNMLLEILGRGGKYDQATRVFESEMLTSGVQPDLNTFTIMVNIYGKARRPEKAARVFRSIYGALLVPDGHAFVALINAYAAVGAHDKAHETFEALLEAGIEPDTHVFNGLLQAHCQADNIDGLICVHNEMTRVGCKPDQGTYHILMSAFGKAGRWLDSVRSFTEMKAAGFAATHVTSMLLLEAYAEAGRVEEAENIVHEMESGGPEPDVRVYNQLLRAYGAAGSFDKMAALYEEMKAGPVVLPNLASHTAMMRSYADHDDQEKCLEVFTASRTNGLVADTAMWTALIAFYAKRKLFRKAMATYEKMVDAGCSSDSSTAKALYLSCRSPEQESEVHGKLQTADTTNHMPHLNLQTRRLGIDTTISAKS